MHLTTLILAGFAGLCCALPVLADTVSYEVDVKIRYDVVVDGVVQPDTLVWGMPDGNNLPSGTLELSVDVAGNVTGATLLHPTYGIGMLYGKRLYKLYNSTLLIEGGTWGTPNGNKVPITSANVTLGDTFFGDFGDLTQVTGSIKDGNSGDFFHLTNGLGKDGKFKLTATGPSGMSVTFKAKTWWGEGTGWYYLGVDGGDMSYSMDANAASVGITGVVQYDLWMDATNHTFHLPEQILLEDFPADWFQLGRRLENFAGTIDGSGHFTGSVHFAGIEFTSLDFSGSGTFTDANSTGFDISNGLSSGDVFTAVLTDQTGLMDMVVTGTLVGQTWADLGHGLAGSTGVPVLTGEGSLEASSPVSLTLSGALPNAPVTMVVGLTQANLPAKMGILVPSPDALIDAGTTDGLGTLQMSSTWPSGLPTGTTLFFQAWIADLGGPAEFAASNGLSATTP